MNIFRDKLYKAIFAIICAVGWSMAYPLPNEDIIDHYYVLPVLTTFLQLYLYEYDTSGIRGLAVWTAPSKLQVSGSQKR